MPLRHIKNQDISRSAGPTVSPIGRAKCGRIFEWKNIYKMLKKPDLKDEEIISCLQNEHELTISQLTFLPLGADINTAVFALAYYRFERIIDDIAAYCDELFSLIGSEEDRSQSLKYLKSNFLPAGTLEAAYTKDATGMG